MLDLTKYKGYFDYYIGDIHGQLEEITHCIIVNIGIANANIFFLGDIGMGFHKEGYYTNILRKMETKLRKNNVNFIMLRGNHDDPSYFVNGKYNTEHIFFVDDYEIVKTETHTTLCIGGARSIDKFDRWKIDKKTKKIVPDGYWYDEMVKPIPNDFKTKINDFYIDVICTHCAPNNVVFNHNFNEELIEKDEKLIEDINHDQNILFEVWEMVKPLNWFYGHYHRNATDIIDCTTFKCCDKYIAGYKPTIETIY